MNTLDAYLNQVVWALIGALPWFIGIALAGVLITWSPLGKLLVRYLRDRARNDGLLDVNNAQLAEVTHALSAMTERLDATEQLLVRLARGEKPFSALPSASVDTASEGRTPTPH